MSFYSYQESKWLTTQTKDFYGVLMTAMRLADTNNLELLKNAFPVVWEELDARYNAPGGILAHDPILENSK